MDKKLVIYHANCRDGFCSAYVISKTYPDAEFIPYTYQKAPPDVTNRDVIIADFSFKRDVLLEMKTKAKSILVLDHHETAEKDLVGLDFCIFDMKRSGAGISADYFGHRNWLVDYVEDRDLWNWKLPKSKEVNLALDAFPMDFTVWGHLDKDTLIKMGENLILYQNSLIDSICKNATEVEFDGYIVRSVNSPVLIPELGDRLAHGYPFAIIWRKDKEKFIYSLRSRGDKGLNVATIASKMGGGGHLAASSFSSDRLLV